MLRCSEDQIQVLADILKQDGCISVPTDTVYGVCARMDSWKAQEKLREVKHRPETKAFPIMCMDAKQIQSIAVVNPQSEKLIAALMPGPVTLILPKKEGIPDFVNGGMDTLAIRMATSDALVTLIRLCGSPIFMTSANQSGEPVCTSLDEIEKSCPDLDGMLEGNVSFGEASTILDCTKATPAILRPGPITMEQVQAILK